MSDSLDALRERVRARLGGFDQPLRILAEAIHGEADVPIDWVAAEPDGRACVVLLASGPSEPGLVAIGLAQRAWVERRLPDWLQLAPALGVRPGVRPRLLLLASSHPALTEAAARAADPEGISLATLSELERADSCAPAPPRAPAVEPPSPEPRSDRPLFRSGLAAEDLGVTPQERSTLLDSPPRGAHR